MTIHSVNPKDGSLLQEYDLMDQIQIADALAQADEAFQSYRHSSFAERAEKMLRVADILDAEGDYYARMMCDEMGKTIFLAQAEVKKCALVCRYYAEHAQSFLADRPIQTEFSESFVRYLPIGPVLAVMPWNFPFWQVFRFAAPALMAGNVGLLKHASNVPGCALAIDEIFGQAGFPKGVFQSLLISSSQVADVIADERVRAVTLTGSEGAGSSVAAQAGKHIKKCVLELGGSDPFIVMPSADLDKAVDLALKARIHNNGQTCIAAKRYIVHEDVYERFRDALIGRYDDLHVGDPLDPQTDVGPLASLGIREELDRQVKETLAAGAVCLSGAYIIEGDGHYYRPGLLEEIPKDSPAYYEELFGPVGLLFKVSSLEDAVTLANDSRFGLGSAIFTQDRGEMEYAMDNLEAGCTFVNAMVASDPRLPFGGVKYSGFGRELSEDGIREFCNIKTICVS